VPKSTNKSGHIADPDYGSHTAMDNAAVVETVYHKTRTNCSVKVNIKIMPISIQYVWPRYATKHSYEEQEHSESKVSSRTLPNCCWMLNACWFQVCNYLLHTT